MLYVSPASVDLAMCSVGPNLKELVYQYFDAV